MIKLKSKDPFDYPSINPRYLSDPGDVNELIGSVRIWKKLMQTPTMKSLGVTLEEARISFCFIV